MTPERYAFLKSLQENDLIRLNGTLRVIRRIVWQPAKRSSYDRGWFYFIIRRCSWTGRGYTLRNSTDLAHLPIELVARNTKMKTQKRLVEVLRIEMDHPHIRSGVTCCNVQGLV